MILPKDILDNLLDRLKELNLYPVIGAEIEFYLNPICPNFQEKLEIIAEKGENQFEIRIIHSNDIKAVIEKITSVKQLLLENGADLSAKPFATQPGSALHIHLHLEDAKGNNLYRKENSDESLLLLHSIGGLCSSMKENMLLFAPYEAAYLRYTTNSMESPSKICWGGNNRSAAIRIPLSDKNNRRLEHRVACSDSDANDVIAAILYGVLQGIEKQISPPEKLHGIAFMEQYEFPLITQSYDIAKDDFKKSGILKYSK